MAIKNIYFIGFFLFITNAWAEIHVAHVPPSLLAESGVIEYEYSNPTQQEYFFTDTTSLGTLGATTFNDFFLTLYGFHKFSYGVVRFDLSFLPADATIRSAYLVAKDVSSSINFFSVDNLLLDNVISGLGGSPEALYKGIKASPSFLSLKGHHSYGGGSSGDGTVYIPLDVIEGYDVDKGFVSIALQKKCRYSGSPGGGNSESGCDFYSEKVYMTLVYESRDKFLTPFESFSFAVEEDGEASCEQVDAVLVGNGLWKAERHSVSWRGEVLISTNGCLLSGFVLGDDLSQANRGIAEDGEGAFLYDFESVYYGRLGGGSFLHRYIFSENGNRYVLADFPYDHDLDGLPDYWEVRMGLSTNDASDALKDPDGDHYLNIEEYLSGTNPRSNDLISVYAGLTLAGDFNGWDVSLTNMSLVTDHVWKGTVSFTNIQGIAFKFSADYSWSSNWGGNVVNSIEPYQGTGVYFGANIEMTNVFHGVYSFSFNDDKLEFLVEKIASFDMDGDGVDDDWEVLYGFSTSTVLSSTIDDDLDGVSSYDEYIAGTDPLDSLSLPHLNVELDTTSEGVVFQWETSLGRAFWIEHSTSTVPFSWETVRSGIATGSVMRLSHPTFNRGEGLYRLKFRSL